MEYSAWGMADLFNFKMEKEIVTFSIQCFGCITLLLLRDLTLLLKIKEKHPTLRVMKNS